MPSELAQQVIEFVGDDFSLKQINRALQRADNDVDDAIALLFDGELDDVSDGEEADEVGAGEPAKTKEDEDGDNARGEGVSGQDVTVAQNSSERERALSAVNAVATARPSSANEERASTDCPSMIAQWVASDSAGGQVEVELSQRMDQLSLKSTEVARGIHAATATLPVTVRGPA
jgi:hypothetical protein